jgi:hypothetical protein
MMADRLPVSCLPGELYEGLERSFAPGAADVRQILLRLRGQLHWPRSMLAAFMGVSRDVVRRWETGERNPCGAARRLIWLLDMLVRRPEKLQSGLDLIFWGKGDECRRVGSGTVAGRRFAGGAAQSESAQSTFAPARVGVARAEVGSR